MKNVGIGLSMLSMVLLMACDKKEEKTTEVIETNTIEKETVIVKDTVKEKDGTSVKISSDGVDVDSKDKSKSRCIPAFLMSKKSYSLTKSLKALVQMAYPLAFICKLSSIKMSFMGSPFSNILSQILTKTALESSFK